MNSKFVYQFSKTGAEAPSQPRRVLGGKGAGLLTMSRLGIAVPPGFVISTEMCAIFNQSGQLPEVAWAQVEASMRCLQRLVGKQFGGRDPLLVSVRSGAAVSMPGMMDTVLNLGLTRDGVQALESNQGVFIWDSYCRLLHMYGSIVLGIPDERLAPLARRRSRVVKQQDKLKLLCHTLELLLEEYGGLPQDPWLQLREAIGAVFRSWHSERAKLYRRLNNISDSLGTAVTVQVMVFGNRSGTSGTGVAFTRDPNTGEKKLFGEWLACAQGEDVVAGGRTPLPLRGAEGSLESTLPEVYKQLVELQKKLEDHFGDMQDLEFTVEDGKLYLLQTRAGKRSALAGVRIAVDLAREGRISKQQALERVAPADLVELLFARVDRTQQLTRLGKGLAASPGAVSGKVALSSAAALQLCESGEPVILVREETSPDDLEGMAKAVGILTARGGVTSHAAVVARGMGKSCVVGCGDLSLSHDKKTLSLGTAPVLQEGDWISLDGCSGEIFLGKVPTIEGSLTPHVEQLLSWADDVASMGVRANADTPEQAERALQLGAKGIGLCRTEHMFFAQERLPWMQVLILTQDAELRAQALTELREFQTADFAQLFRTMAGHPVTIRLLDPPLHEFLPKERSQLEGLAERQQMSVEALQRRVEALAEANPMLGHRGVRLSVSMPEIVSMQVQAIMTAACLVAQEGLAVQPEIKVPLVMSGEEMAWARGRIVSIAESVLAELGRVVPYRVGVMIELPRAALLADQIAEHADFMSFGTNDLTQTTLGISRDDAGRFLPEYCQKGLLRADPFVHLDQEGVGSLMRTTCKLAEQSKPSMSVGLCGEHGGDPESIEFCQGLGLKYVSCSPFRVPVARLACAHAALEAQRMESIPPSRRSA